MVTKYIFTMMHTLPKAKELANLLGMITIKGR
jgi:hypothetical protein